MMIGQLWAISASSLDRVSATSDHPSWVKLEDPDMLPKPLDADFFKNNVTLASSPEFTYHRQLSCRFNLPPGTYAIVPSTFEPNEEGEFLLRIFSENQNNMEENDVEVGISEIDDRPDRNEKKIRELFRKLAGDDMEVDRTELKNLLDCAIRKEMNNDGFSKDICRSMVAMLDVDQSGKLGFEEFKNLRNVIRNCRAVFKLYDKDGSGHSSAFELRQALNSASYRLNNHILNVLGHRCVRKRV